MKPVKKLIVLGMLISVATLVVIFSVSCDDPGSTSDGDDGSTQQCPCILDVDCPVDEKCIDGVCECTKCKEMGGYCEFLDEPCQDGYFDWASLECPQGRDGKCCLPEGSCEAVGGVCIPWNETCPSGTGAYGCMDCPEGMYQQCCIPVR